MRIPTVDGSGDRDQSTVPGSGESVSRDAPAVTHRSTRPCIDGCPGPGRAVGGHHDHEGAPGARGARRVCPVERVTRWTGRIRAETRCSHSPGLLLPLEPRLVVGDGPIAVIDEPLVGTSAHIDGAVWAT